jgi:hypothetical protein
MPLLAHLRGWSKVKFSSNSDTYKKTCKFLAKKFRARNSPYRLVRSAFQQVPFSLRESYPKEHNPVPFVCTCQAQFAPKNLRHAIKADNNLRITEEPIIAYKKTENIVVSSLADRTKQPKRSLKLLPKFPECT